MKLVLGSGSPRRKELLGQLGMHIDDVRPPDVDETPFAGELPRNYCNRVTRSKVDAITLGADEVALCGDTTVALGRQILGKPADADEARAFLAKNVRSSPSRYHICCCEKGGHDLAKGLRQYRQDEGTQRRRD